MRSGAARPVEDKLELLKRWGVIWEYLVDREDQRSITVWLKERESVDYVLVGILGGGVAREQIHVVRERPPIVMASS
jgi:hypothetical protein